MTDLEFCLKMEVDLLDSYRDGYLEQEEMNRLILLCRLGALARIEAAKVAE